MDKINIRIISFGYDSDCFQRIKEAFSKVLASYASFGELVFSDIIPYWKHDGYGESYLSFRANYSEEIDKIKSLLSSVWESDVTDSRWATIFCEDIYFMWMTGEDEEGWTLTCRGRV